MAKKYTINLTDENIQSITEDPEMDGITLEASAEDGSKIMVNLVKTAATVEQPAAEETVETEEESAEIGNIAPEEEAAMQAEATQENIGFTNESAIKNFDSFLKL
jgi:hypothetical protein